jgi:hypothetical protein
VALSDGTKAESKARFSARETKPVAGIGLGKMFNFEQISTLLSATLSALHI